MKKYYAYLDKYEFMHITETEETAKLYAANGKVIATDIEGREGYPGSENPTEKKKDGTPKWDEIIVSGVNAYRLGTDNAGVVKNTEKDYPELAALYKQLT